MKKIPMRTCVVTRECLPKKELLRIVRTPELKVVIDETGKMNGRGAYIKRSLETVDLAIKRKSLSRALNCEIEEDVYTMLKEMFKNE